MPNSIDNDLTKLIRIAGMPEEDILSAKASGGETWTEIQHRLSDHARFLAMGESHTRQKAIQDPVHGPILFAPWELDLISSWEMLRLRFVKQLGPAHMVYPGATHTRFQHCLGTNYLAQKCIGVINYCDNLDTAKFHPLSNLLDEYHQKIFRATALLHDIGHPPASHTIEFALESYAGLTHVDLGEYLILNSSITDILESHDIDPSKVVNILQRRTNDPIMSLIADFMDSPLDLDKTDYLIRDAHFSGVQLGVFPAERVMLTNRVVKNREGRYLRAFMLKALHSLEALILSRNWMFSDLYLHHAVRVAEALISKATYFRMKEEKLSRNECVGFFTRMTDEDLYRWLRQSDIDFVREYAARFRYRRLFKVAVARPLGAFEPHIEEELLDLNDNIDALIEAEHELSQEPGSVILDVVKPELGEKTLRNIPLLIGGEKTGLEIVDLEDTDEGKPLAHAITQQERTIPSVRVYAPRHMTDEIRMKFNRKYPVSDRASHKQDEYDMYET
ncbi:MAG: HD domain-containing protein [Promethearchaeia archaeon]